MVAIDEFADRRLLIFGASTRAAAQSAVRAGYHPYCADRFADEDLFETAEVLSLGDYPSGLTAAAACAPYVPWVYTGALENRPDLVSELSRLRPLLGNPAETLRRVRDPFQLFDVLSRARLPVLEVRAGQSPPSGGQWLLKPQAGGAGRGIVEWTPSSAIPADAEDWYFQHRAQGESIAALYLGLPETTVMIGATRQWIGVEAFFGDRFWYCGSAGPLALEQGKADLIAATGAALGKAFALRGLFGIDYVLEEGTAWPTEVNPRYTASVEVYERALGLPLLLWHCRACRSWDGGTGSELAEQIDRELTEVRRRRASHFCAKGVIYAPFALRAPDLGGLSRTPRWTAEGWEIADRPQFNSLIPLGAPVCTLLVDRGRLPEPTVFDSAIRELENLFERHRSPC